MADEANVDLPFAAEYAKSARASCKQCKGNIAKESLRLAVMVQAPKFDGKMPNWYHFACFFGNNRVKTIADFKDFDKLRWEDQEKIKEKVVPHGAGGVPADTKEGDALVKDYSVEVAQNARRMCKGCKSKFAKGQVIVSKKDYESDSARRFGPQDAWHHLQCFLDKRNEFEFFADGSVLPGFKSLSSDEQQEVKSKLPAMKVRGLKRVHEDAIDSVKRKKTPASDDEERLLKKQNKLVYDFRDNLKKNLNKKNLQHLLEYNDQEIPPGESRILDQIAECMAFGATLPCPECKNGQLVFGTGGYKCHGDLSEWTKCTYITKSPKRKPFKVPKELQDEFPFLKSYKYEERERLFSSVEEKPSIKPKEEDTTKPPLSGLSFSIIGSTKVERPDLKKAIEKLGGRVVSKLEKITTAVISTQEEIDNSSRKIKEAEELNVHVVSEDFVQKAKGISATSIVSLIKSCSLCSWGADLTDKIKTPTEGKKSAELPSKSGSSLTKVTLKGKAAVDADSGLEGRAHVLEEKSNIYSCVLGMVDIGRGTNSFYRLQILESDKSKKYWLFRSWGRIGTKIGGTKCEKKEDKDSAKEDFLALYEEKTGNQWSKRHNFVKRPNKFYPMDVDYGDDEKVKEFQERQSSISSKLMKPVQDLITMILNIETMKRTMIEFEIDLSKMPLGKLSKKQVQIAYGILTELMELIKGQGSEFKFLDASNRFFTLIPHDFGLQKPPVLKSEDTIKSKIEMLDNLLEIELAYNLLKEDSGPSDVNPIDANYAKLNTNIEVLNNKVEEYELLTKYTLNTHASTHNQYSLKIEEIFSIDRKGEASRFKPFKKLPNRRLLWHGSRITNFAGILSQGLRIAPPEAPSTGYMFGKGLYFADLVSKSANYCFATKDNPYGLLLLCEVALGNMYELKNADFIKKLPTGKHSTKGVGSTHPDPSEVHTTKDGVIVPFGKPVKTDVNKTSLLYNEYIVYDVAQVKIKYLLKVKFDWKF